jgi:hypothetical protein
MARASSPRARSSARRIPLGSKATSRSSPDNVSLSSARGHRHRRNSAHGGNAWRPLKTRRGAVLSVRACLAAIRSG